MILPINPAAPGDPLLASLTRVPLRSAVKVWLLANTLFRPVETVEDPVASTGTFLRPSPPVGAHGSPGREARIRCPEVDLTFPWFQMVLMPMVASWKAKLRKLLHTTRFHTANSTKKTIYLVVFLRS